MKAVMQTSIFSTKPLQVSAILAFGAFLIAPLTASAQVTSLEYQRTTADIQKKAAAIEQNAAGKPGKPGKPSGKCEDTGEKCGDPVTAGPTVKSGDFPCKGNSKAKDDAMKDILDQLKIDPPPGCTSGGCEERKSCGMTGLLSPNGDPVDFDLVEMPEGSGKCHYEGKIYQDGPACMKAECGCK